MKKCKTALSKSGQILIVERINGNKSSLLTLLGDIEMMMMTEGGKERTSKEFEQLFKRVGFSSNTKFYEMISRNIFRLRLPDVKP